MYEEFYGLREKPFSIQPDPSFLYWGRGHRLAYAMLEYGVLNHAGISVITGEVGCGKTTLIHRLLEQLSDSHSIALLSNIQQGRGDLLSWVLMGFGQPYAGKTHVELFSDLQQFFISEYSKGRRVIVVIDEAQNLSADMLEELRMLSNINAGKDQLLQLILVGQPQLKGILNHPDMLQLAQRVGADFHLTPLTRDEVRAYIDTRLTIAGATRRIFSDRAVDLIAETSRGVPRVINVISDTALVYGFSGQDMVVDEETIKAVVHDKGQYGVFGIAADQKLEPPKAEPRGPSSFLNTPQPSVEARVASGAASSVVGDATHYGNDYGHTPSQGDMRLDTGQEEEGDVALLSHPAPTTYQFSPKTYAGSTNSSEFSYDDEAQTIENEDASTSVAVEAPVAASSSEIIATTLEEVGVIVCDLGLDRQAHAVAEGTHAVFIAALGAEEKIAAAKNAGYDVVTVKDNSVSAGRAWNAGYRRLKKSKPDIAYVQFVGAGVQLEDSWLETATRFMDRRPEVAVIEGAQIDLAAQNSVYALSEALAADRSAGEIVSARGSAFVRAEAFEAAGGFRGDAPGVEMEDLCLRLRRRGGHIWRVDHPMSRRDSGLRGFSRWWEARRQRGVEYALGANLHGGSPERYRARERARAFVWGMLIPFGAILMTLGATLWQYLENGPREALIALMATSLFSISVFAVYGILKASSRGREPKLVFRAVLAALSPIPEFFGNVAGVRNSSLRAR